MNSWLVYFLFGLLINPSWGAKFIRDSIWNEDDFESYGTCYAKYRPIVFKNELFADLPLNDTNFKAESPSQTVTLWPSGRIPYELTDDFNLAEERMVACAMLFFKDNTCIRFVSRSQNDVNYVQVKKDNGQSCSSTDTGMAASWQVVFLGRTCWKLPLIIHELMHVVGFNHEHAREDRDQFIRILWDNIPADWHNQFKKNSENGYRVPLVGNYDYKSIMHYTRVIPVSNGKPAMAAVKEPIDRNNAVMGKGTIYGPNQRDIIKIKLLYHC